ncbi:hypothetical protein GXW83_21515 [Streptacidiphilus sp. PB12-B1b]|uniref:hypothetical protein n=1 Tax=Streptacidiphilus sp. PB12-B1b TaxID=2705012 RepID=UPI0015FA9A21|nr:hypothetical protein [Streptacidiphilus sp. PB12-B1b]QMU77889.1 hypothetical protein GXW83_21515 [Streptacidiphilus sp. PB12-B1b]
MTQRTGDRPCPEVRDLARVIPLHAALRPGAEPTEPVGSGPGAVLPGPWHWFTHRDIPRTGGDPS